MNFPPYPFTRFQEADEAVLYAFTSSSPQRTIQKLVIFTPIDKDQHNVALVELLTSGELSDTAVSSHQDMEQVLATSVITKRLYSGEFGKILLTWPVVVQKQQEAKELLKLLQNSAIK